MSLEDDIAFLEQVPTFAALGRPALQVLAIGAETLPLPAGAVLFHAGELADGAYLVREGTLTLEPGTFSQTGEVTAGPGTLVGELALITDTVCPTTAIARESAVVVRISRNLFRKMLEGYPGAADKLRETMTRRLQDWTRELSAVRRKLEK